jgi:hypothetical protein
VVEDVVSPHQTSVSNCLEWASKSHSSSGTGEGVVRQVPTASSGYIWFFPPSYLLLDDGPPSLSAYPRDIGSRTPIDTKL